MSASKSDEKTSTYQQSWQQWDKAWALNLSQDARVAFLKEATGAKFIWSNGDHIVEDGDLAKLAQRIEQLLQEAGNALTVRHLKWWEHHRQSALQWDMVHVDTGAVLVSGFSYGSYDEHGKLLSVADFY